MGLMTRVTRSLFPDGSPWTLSGTFGDVVDALALSLDRARDFLEGVETESNAGTAEDTLAEWYSQLGIPYDPTQDLDRRQAKARQAATAIGGQDLAYLNAQIQVAFPDVEIVKVNFQTTNMVGVGMVGLMQVQDYPSWYSGTTDGTYPYAYYRVTGEVDDTWDLNTVEGILTRIAPAEMEPVYAVTIRNLTPTAEVGLGMVGIMQVGRDRT